MFIRVMIVAAYIYPDIMQSILIPGAMMFLGLAGVTLFFFVSSRGERVVVVEDEKKGNYESPFQLVPALQFAALIVMIKFIAIL
jgi:uncharacterized membrane protein (DUF4010 family)